MSRTICSFFISTAITISLFSASGCKHAREADGEEFDTETSTDTNPNSLPVVDLENVESLLNPYVCTGLVAVVKVSHQALDTEDVDQIYISQKRVGGQQEELSTYLYPQSLEYQTNFNVDDLLEPNEFGVPILGLYPGVENQITLRIYTDSRIFACDVSIVTPRIKDQENETVSIDIYNQDAMEPGWTSLNDRVYDHNGDCRWVGPQIHYILTNGNLLNTTRINERSITGRLIIDRTSILPNNFEVHHDSIELPNRNLLVCVNNNETSIINGDGASVTSWEDYVLELDYLSSSIVNAWDLREFLDVDRYTLTDENYDWIHMNTLAYDETDDSVLMSARYQGIVKLTRGGIQGESPNKGKELIWIMAPHLDWGMSGWDGGGDLNPNDYLLTAVDSNGTPYNEDVQNNLAAPQEGLDDFHWPIGQHGLRITSREEGKLSILTFNNQASVIFDGPGSTDNQLYGDLENDRSKEPYSLMVVYEVDEIERTVKQVWSYGENMPEYFCSYQSGVNLLSHTENRLMVSCGIDRNPYVVNPFNPHIVEFGEQGDVIFHLEIVDTELSAYRTARIDLYHPDRAIKYYQIRTF